MEKRRKNMCSAWPGPKPRRFPRKSPGSGFWPRIPWSRSMGKPQDAAEAETMLRLLSGKEHRVTTGYCLLRSSPFQKKEGVVTSHVRFKALAPGEILWYVQTGEPFDKAGGYAIQGRAAFMVREVKGSYTNVVGLPLCEVVEALQAVDAIGPFGE